MKGLIHMKNFEVINYGENTLVTMNNMIQMMKTLLECDKYTYNIKFEKFSDMYVELQCEIFNFVNLLESHKKRKPNVFTKKDDFKILEILKSIEGVINGIKNNLKFDDFEYSTLHLCEWYVNM